MMNIQILALSGHVPIARAGNETEEQPGYLRNLEIRGE